MQNHMIRAAVVLLTCTAALPAATIRFETDPFAGSNALATPGRQVVGGEDFVTFDIASDIFSLDPNVFGLSSIQFVNDTIGNVPASGANVIVLRTLDNDNDGGTPFNAGTAANLIADQITTSGPGLFIYFNSGLNLPRLVFSTDLSDNTADLKILSRMTNLFDDSVALSAFTAANFELVETIPEPATASLVVLAAALLAARKSRARLRN